MGGGKINAVSAFLLSISLNFLADHPVGGTILISNESYILKYFYALEYGSGLNEIGIFIQPDSPRLGPYAFAVDRNGEIYIADPVNECIKIFLPGAGTITKAIPLEGLYDDLLVDKKGNIFLLQRTSSRIVIIEPTGEISSINISPEIALRPCTLFLLNDTVMLAAGEETYSPYSGVKSQGISLGSGQSCWTEWEDEQTGLVKILDRDSQKLKSLTLKKQGLCSIVFLGEDLHKNIYVQIEYKISETKIGLEVYKLNKEGKKIAVIGIPENDYWIWTSRLLFVDENGAIYQVLPGQRNVKIKVWEPRIDSE